MTKFAFWIAALGVGARFECGECAKHDLTSSDLKEGGTIVNEQVFKFKGFGCTGGNVSPDLSWSGAPSRTKSFAVSIYDPDAPTGGWWQLGCVQYFTRYDVVAQGRRRREEKADAEGRYSEPYRLRSRRIRWPLPADRRQAASLSSHGFSC
jgi:phosphatidylethanolamine-binding protein (PEBP) family uncharacterized protein